MVQYHVVDTGLCVITQHAVLGGSIYSMPRDIYIFFDFQTIPVFIPWDFAANHGFYFRETG